MSEENLKQFMSKVADSEELQAKIGEEIDAEALNGAGYSETHYDFATYINRRHNSRQDPKLYLYTYT